MVHPRWSCLTRRGPTWQQPTFRSRLKRLAQDHAPQEMAVVVTATQQVSDIANSEIADVVPRIARPRSCCPTRRRVTLAHANSTAPWASTSVNSSCYQAESVPKQHYYVVSKLRRRLVDLRPGKVVVANWLQRQRA